MINGRQTRSLVHLLHQRNNLYFGIKIVEYFLYFFVSDLRLLPIRRILQLFANIQNMKNPAKIVTQFFGGVDKVRAVQNRREFFFFFFLFFSFSFFSQKEIY
jgi:hypothetical protein